MLGLIGSGQHDINGLAWRSDGQLVALDRVQNALLLIDPTTRATSVLASLGPTVGAVGGMVLSNDQGWFATSGPSGTDPGSNGLYAFDAFTGNYSLVGSFSPTITGTGISGLAISVPEPSFAGFALGWFLLWLAVRLLSKGFLGKSIARK